MRENPNIVVVCGGSSAEAEVSRVSGRCVADALRFNFPNTVLLELDGSIAEGLRLHRVDAVFPVLHGPPGEDGSFQGLLEILGYPYVGSGVRASACAMDKSLAKELFRRAGLPVARDVLTRRSEGIESAARRAEAELGASLVVKPATQGSALGVAFPETRKQLE
ncbi:MAG: D-alanine--D-alanine ligase, partial [Methylococcaceae bacterium]|nr:D-alanine--D-alanine ligase [Methylococcaceae bacterium]